MSGDNNPSFAGADPFTTFWTDMMGRMASAGMTPPSPGREMADGMRKAFFEVMAEQADQFMRSEPFLAAMKQSMDNSLAWRQQMNEFLTKGLSAAQMPSRSDVEHTGALLRGMEERILRKLDELSERVERLEQAQGRKAPASPKT